MSRPTNTDPEATKHRILTSAIQLFSERGLDGTTVRDIAKGADVTLATVHHHFGSKDALFDACVSSVYDELGAMAIELRSVIAESESMRAVVTRAISVTFRFALKHKVVIRLLLRVSVAAGRVPERGREMLAGEFVPMLAMVAGKTEIEIRLCLQTLVFLVSRYAVEDPDALAGTLGLPRGSRREARDLVEEHLIALALGLLGVGNNQSTD
jgi:AcrR family transcriptional regulator